MSEIKEKLCYTSKSVAETLSQTELENVESYAKDYIDFMNRNRTEREVAAEAVRLAKAAGFKEFSGDEPLKPGDKIYRLSRGKAVYLAVIGKSGVSDGTRICASHIDSPRLDLKQLPLFESDGIAFFKTHYYGGIRKYQWLTIPLELHGVVITKDGVQHEIRVGSDPEDPVFVISDLLPHLERSQAAKTVNDFVPGERLNLIAGTMPLKDEDSDDKESDKVKLAVLKLLNDKYGITETDFLSAELEVVPALPTREVGLDRSLIGSYAHDDRVCAYAILNALLSLDAPEHTAVCLLADKEEIGSMGVTGMESQAFDCFIEDICDSLGVKTRRCVEKSLCLSSDVSVAYDPMFPEVFEKNNTCRLNHGIGIMKGTGHRGKYDGSEASAELMARIRKILDDNGVVWQTGEIGKVDEGGGGTVALYLANRNIDTIDAGTPVISMHSPYEVVSKLDCYMTMKAAKAVYED